MLSLFNAKTYLSGVTSVQGQTLPPLTLHRTPLTEATLLSAAKKVPEERALIIATNLYDYAYTVLHRSQVDAHLIAVDDLPGWCLRAYDWNERGPDQVIG